MPMLTNMPSRFLGGGRLATPVPVLGAELLANGDFETWASATDAGTWTEQVAGTSTVNRDGTEQRGGTYCARLDVDGSNNQARIYQTRGSLTAGTWYLATAYVKASAPAKSAVLTWNGQASNITPGTSYQMVAVINRASGTSHDLIIGKNSAANASLYLDDISLKAITLASMFSTRPYGTHVTVKAQATVVAGTRAGVICNLDSASSPANFVIGSHDGTTARLTKNVAGTYTELISTAVSYVAGAYLEIRRPAGGDIWQLFYNGSQVGADQTISDAAIKAATLAGMFNTYHGNVLAGFSCVPS
ncbi:MAG: hypothetical protein U0X20_32910 [Caldilineaceae bacterium]